jgi:signal transduction histidine kinase
MVHICMACGSALSAVAPQRQYPRWNGAVPSQRRERALPARDRSRPLRVAVNHWKHPHRGAMSLAEYVEANKERLVSRWKQLATDRLALRLDESELLNHLPVFLDDLVVALRSPSQTWPATESAASHGRHRMRSGIDIGALTQEMALITEALCELSAEDVCDLPASDLLRLTRALGRGTAASARAYAAMRDQELSRQAAEHFSFIAHELRTPLQTACLAAALMDGGAGDELRAHYHERLQRSLTQISDLVDEALIRMRLSFSSVVHAEALESVELIESALDQIIDLARARGIRVTSQVEPFTIEADRKLLLSAITNVVKNAVKFTRVGGGIVVRAAGRDTAALIEVEDECGGMPDDLPPRLFQPFLQGHPNRNGFGLGLAIVKQAMEAHNGSVRVTNRRSVGCTFVLELPLHMAPPRAFLEEETRGHRDASAPRESLRPSSPTAEPDPR